MSYETELLNKKFVPNTVIYFMGKYWSIRTPDSGLVVDYPGYLDQVTINPTQVDPFKASTTINTYNFTLVDKSLNVTAMFLNSVRFFQAEQVKIWIGRTGVGMDFSEYLPLPDTFVSAVSKDANSYKFSSKEAKDRLNRPAFDIRNKSEVDILEGTTIIDADSILDGIFPTAGLFKLEDEFISYTGIDTVNNRFTGCVRGEYNSIPVDHKAGGTIYLVTAVTANPIDIILQVILSSGGGSVYDVLSDGAGIDQSLVNITQFELIRDEFFLSQTYELLFYGTDNILQFLEEQILYANDLRIVTDNTSKVSLAILNRSIFNDSPNVIDNDTIKAQPAYTVDDSEVSNVINIQYDYVEGTDSYLKLYSATDDDSVTNFGRRTPIEISLKGVKADLDGEAIVTNIAQRFLSRFSIPRPEISFTTQMDKSLINLTEKITLESTQIPSQDGDLQFADTVEVLERGINFKTGDVKFRVGFTSFTGIRECYLAPSDTALTFVDDSTITVATGRGVLYKSGWMMRMYDNSTRDYVSTQVNEIDTIVGDTITFVDPWGGYNITKEDTFDLLQEDGSNILYQDPPSGQLRIMFADYDDVVDTQKKYCFISDNGAAFADGKKTYQITL